MLPLLQRLTKQVVAEVQVVHVLQVLVGDGVNAFWYRHSDATACAALTSAQAIAAVQTSLKQ